MKIFALSVASIFGFFSVLLGALGAHQFKKILSIEKLTSFETGVKYQMYHAIVLLLIGYIFSFKTTSEKTMLWCFLLGTILFSCSIYLLCFQDYWKINLKFLGPITPLGGLLLLFGWFLMLWNIFKLRF